jgi:hypothetical protein
MILDTGGYRTAEQRAPYSTGVSRRGRPIPMGGELGLALRASRSLDVAWRGVEARLMGPRGGGGVRLAPTKWGYPGLAGWVSIRADVVQLMAKSAVLVSINSTQDSTRVIKSASLRENPCPIFYTKKS